MRKDWLNITSKLSIKFGIENIVFRLAQCLWPINVPKNITWEEGERYLNSLWLKKQTSCLTHNTVATTPQYDLQIIVPCFNVAEYIEECIDSILNQKTGYNYKVIIVNDGSTDNTRQLLKRYESINNVIIIDMANQGVSAARNVALKHIDAKYLMFVDSDDRLPDNAIETLISKAEELQADIVEGNHIYFYENKTLRTSGHTNDNDAPITSLYGMACGRIYQSKIWEEICFPLGYWFEDTIDWLIIYQRDYKLATISDIIYYYRATPTGLSMGYNTSVRRIQTYWITKYLLEDAKQLGITPTQEYYETLLKQCKLNTRRIAMLGNRKADYALFVAQRQLLEQYFKDYSTENPGLRDVARALQEDDFKTYLLHCLFFRQ